MEDKIRLHIIERELDNTDPDGPYRVSRQKLNREKRRILKRKEKRDPMWFATGRRGATAPKSCEAKDYRIKKQIVTILEEIERRSYEERNV